jgi:hypothetical protein
MHERAESGGFVTGGASMAELREGAAVAAAEGC